tara:strand:+ start:429 stop:683 length:255 start_codon:yes stop_codon:yes gene_type:complete
MKEFNENISKMEQFFADDMATTLRKMANKLNKTPWHATEEKKERSSLLSRVTEVEAELATVKDNLFEFYTYINKERIETIEKEE